MKLSQLLERLNYECVQGSVDIPVSHLLYDSRNACPDGVFARPFPLLLLYFAPGL